MYLNCAFSIFRNFIKKSRNFTGNYAIAKFHRAKHIKSQA